MKKISWIVLGFAIAACSPQAGAPATQEDGATPAPITAVTDKEGYVLLHDLALWTEKDGVLVWSMNLALGDKVTLLEQTGTFKTEGSTKDREFIKVKYDAEREGWVLPAYIAQDAKLGVVSADPAQIFSEPREIKVTANSLSAGTVVAVFNNGGAGEFLRVTGNDYTKNAFYGDKTFVMASDVTTTESDVNAMIFFTAASKAKSKEVKINMLTVAMNKYADSVFAPKIQAALDEARGVVKKDSTPVSGSFIALDDKVAILDVPDEKLGKSVGALAQDTVVQVVEMTTQTYTVGGKTAPWYKIADPQGWVFGGSLTPAE